MDHYCIFQAYSGHVAVTENRAGQVAVVGTGFDQLTSGKAAVI